MVYEFFLSVAIDRYYKFKKLKKTLLFFQKGIFLIQCIIYFQSTIIRKMDRGSVGYL
jgi:hypothetical protein